MIDFGTRNLELATFSRQTTSEVVSNNLQVNLPHKCEESFRLSSERQTRKKQVHIFLLGYIRKSYCSTFVTASGGVNKSNLPTLLNLWQWSCGRTFPWSLSRTYQSTGYDHSIFPLSTCTAKDSVCQGTKTEKLQSNISENGTHISNEIELYTLENQHGTQ